MSSYKRNPIHNIQPSVYQHPADKMATAKLHENAAFQKAISFLTSRSIEKMISSLYYSSYPCLTPHNAPLLFEMIHSAQEMFNVTTTPAVFIEHSYDMKATLLGMEKPFILISTEWLKQMDETMLFGLIGSEIAAINTGYCALRTIDYTLGVCAGLIPQTISIPLGSLLTQWRKYAQMTFDRSMLIATGDFNATMRSILCGESTSADLMSTDFLDPDCGYRKQCEQYLAKDSKAMDFIVNASATFSAGIKYPMRYMDLLRFYENDYQDILDDYAD